MASYNKFQAFVQKLGEKKINLGTDQLVIALCNAANAPVVGNSVLADLVQIAYTNLSNRNLVTTSWINTAGTSKLIIADLTITASGGSSATFRYVVIYSDTSTNDDLICFFDNGADITLADTEQLIVDFDAAAGLLTVV